MSLTFDHNSTLAVTSPDVTGLTLTIKAGALDVDPGVVNRTASGDGKVNKWVDSQETWGGSMVCQIQNSRKNILKLRAATLTAVVDGIGTYAGPIVIRREGIRFTFGETGEKLIVLPFFWDGEPDFTEEAAPE